MQNTSQKIVELLASFKRTIAIVAVVAIMVAIPVTLALNSRSQSLQQQAAQDSPISTPFPTAHNLNPVMKVDVNNDGFSNLTDYALLNDCVNSRETCTIRIQDVTGDGMVDVLDYQELLRQYAQSLPQ